MTSPITAQQVLQRLDENHIHHATLPLQNDVFVILSERGGRVFGPFLSSKGESIFWMNEAFAEADAFHAFLASGDWNQGGERIWVSPEIQYSVGDRSDFFGTIRIPQQMDPGEQFLSPAGENRWRISQNLSLEAHNLAAGPKQLRLDKWIEPVDDPLRNLRAYDALRGEVLFAGYQQRVRIEETRSDAIASEAWDLVQVRPGGQLLIPTTQHPEYADYFAPVDAGHLSIEPWGMRLQISGRRQYKIGVQSAQTFGRLGYLNRLEDGRAYLIIRNYFNNPSAHYAEEPPALPGRNGFSIHIYNDDGGLGGFGELEVNGQTIGGDSGRSANVDTFVLWFYLGAPDFIQQIASLLLGARLE
jgi:hypothetical protein